MGGVSLGGVTPFNGYKCPWCPTTVMVVDSETAARDWMESHLDAHFLVGLPVTGTDVNRIRPPMAGAA